MKRTEEKDTENFFKDLFDAYDYGPESHRIINGKRCVYWTEGMWISKDRIELDEEDENYSGGN